MSDQPDAEETVIVDYGMGNVGSIANMLNKIHCHSRISSDPAVIAHAKRIILPGVGTFDHGMRELESRGLVPVLHHKALTERVPILGICLGMQLFSRQSEEGLLPGLGWIDAETRHFHSTHPTVRQRVPQMGWNSLLVPRHHAVFPLHIEQQRFYFVHSYHVCCATLDDILATTRYGDSSVVAAIARNNLVGVQFHPEKSHSFGMQLLQNFVNWDCTSSNAVAEPTVISFRSESHRGSGAEHEVTVTVKSASSELQIRSTKDSDNHDDASGATGVRTRVIPCLLLKKGGLVKTVRFSQPKYLGDPINAVKIFNGKEVDELAFLDISATVEGRSPDFDLIQRIAGEAFMPVAYGGGVRSLDDVRRIIQLGIEKVVVNSQAAADLSFIRAAAEVVGRQSIVVSIDVKRHLFGRYEVYTHSGTRPTGLDPSEYATAVAEAGAGEIVLNSIDRDGTMTGYDIPLLRRVASAVRIPVIALGGASGVNDFVTAVRDGGVSAVAAGSLFVFHGKHRAVLITYPEQNVLETAFEEGLPCHKSVAVA